jgi:hypothetical protein
MKYEFSLVLEAAEISDADADRLFVAGCDDASIITSDCVTRIQFDRQAVNLDEALASSIAAVESAGFHVTKVEIERSEVPMIA